MRIESADERNSGWEVNRSRYRVYLFRGGDRPGYSWSVVVKDVLDAEVLEVVAWAEAEIGDDGLYAIALVSEHDGERGLVWLVGMDANDDPGQRNRADPSRRDGSAARAYRCHAPFGLSSAPT